MSGSSAKSSFSGGILSNHATLIYGAPGLTARHTRTGLPAVSRPPG
jgi:hypothetical protein